jgi:hypothetical protein
MLRGQGAMQSGGVALNFLKAFLNGHLPMKENAVTLSNRRFH